MQQNLAGLRMQKLERCLSLFWGVQPDDVASVSEAL